MGKSTVFNSKLLVYQRVTGLLGMNYIYIIYIYIYIEIVIGITRVFLLLSYCMGYAIMKLSLVYWEL